MIGYIQFTIPIIAVKSYYRNIYKRIYSEFQENILYSPSVFEPNYRLTFILFGENVFIVDSVLAKVNSFEGVKRADIYIQIKIQYCHNWIIREIDERLLL